MMAKLAGGRKTKIIASKPRKLCDAGGLINNRQTWSDIEAIYGRNIRASCKAVLLFEAFTFNKL